MIHNDDEKAVLLFFSEYLCRLNSLSKIFHFSMANFLVLSMITKDLTLSELVSAATMVIGQLFEPFN